MPENLVQKCRTNILPNIFSHIRTAENICTNRLWFRSNAECVQNAGYEFTFGYDRNNQCWAELFRNVSIEASEKNQKERYRQKKIAPMKRYNCKLADSLGLLYTILRTKN